MEEFIREFSVMMYDAFFFHVDSFNVSFFRQEKNFSFYWFFSINFFSNVKSPHIVQFYGATLKEKLTMVMELCERGSLFHCLQDKSVIFTWNLFFLMLNEIVLGIKCLHDAKPALFHRDLKVYLLLSFLFSPFFFKVFTLHLSIIFLNFIYITF